MLEPTQLLAYALALGIAAAIPGPGMTALVARTIGSGMALGFAMLAGLLLGDFVYLSFAVFGLAVIANTFSMVFSVIKWFSILYLSYLAWQFWKADHSDLQSTDRSKRSMASAVLSGFTVTLANPKTIAFYMALLPLVIDLEQVSFSTWLYVLVPTTIAVITLVGTSFIVGAHAVRRRLAGKAAQRKLHRGAALAMAGAAGTMIFREL
ncbi:MAG: LysE family translocator [Granulosicoccus sp.]